jgi:hypothetical protein
MPSGDYLKGKYSKRTKAVMRLFISLRPRSPGKWESASKECGRSTKLIGNIFLTLLDLPNWLQPPVLKLARIFLSKARRPAHSDYRIVCFSAQSRCPDGSLGCPARHQSSLPFGKATARSFRLMFSE